MEGRGNRSDNERDLRKKEDGGENGGKSNAEGRRKRGKGMRREEERKELKKEKRRQWKPPRLPHLPGAGGGTTMINKYVMKRW